jgi:hypothetical protein
VKIMAKHRKQQSAFLLAGAAAAVTAAWLGRRHLSLVRGGRSAAQTPPAPPSEPLPLVESPSAELPLGRSADPDIDRELSRKLLPQDETSGASLLGDTAPESTPAESSLDDVWKAIPDLAEPEQTEGYDAVAPEDLGTVWLTRATETETPTDAARAESQLSSELEGSLISEGSISSAHALDNVDDLDDLDAALGRLDTLERERDPESTRQPAKTPKKNAS